MTPFPQNSTNSLKHVARVMKGGEAFFLKNLLENNPSIFYITTTDATMNALAVRLRFFLPDIDVLTLPAWDCLPYDRVSPSVSIVQQRIETLSRIASPHASQKPQVILTTINAALQRVPLASYFSARALTLKTGDAISREHITHFLAGNGYSAVSSAAEPGEFAVRGSIIDIIPTFGSSGFRLDFFDNELESIRTFDPLTQISSGKQEKLFLLPASEVSLDSETIAHFQTEYRNLFGNKSIDDPLYASVSAACKYAGMEHWLPLYHDSLTDMFSYLPQAILCVDSEVMAAKEERLETIHDHYENRKKNRAEMIEGGSSYKPIAPEKLYLTHDEWEGHLSVRNSLVLHASDLPEESTSVDCSQAPSENLFLSAKQSGGSGFDLLKPFLGKEKKVWLACATQGSLERIKHILDTHEIPATHASEWNPNSKPSIHTISLLELPLERGFITDKHIFFSEEDVLGERISRRATPKKNSDILLREASGLQLGEFIVHRDHGIGRFEGLETLQIAGGKHDCLKLIYAGGDRLFLPVENIDLISQFGGDGATAELDKLGGVSWQTRKAKMKKRIKMAAEALLKIAALRKIRIAPVFTATDASYDEFCSRFPYAETEDQLRTIGEVETDLASGKPMDRLVCGDVGFGKTEVALRAAFLATGTDQEGKRGQVAIITPTTLLCRQHHNTFVERFSGFPVRIRQLSRFVTTTEATKIKKDIASGEVDIVIGTHALLSKHIKFHNLALVVVDEEQHFGVKQKEVLKQFRAETHVLTLSATPIPRTLQLSLTGARDLSLITTPPVDRLAVRTFIMPYDPMILREAILRERGRGGRSFYVAPRISDLDDVFKKLKTFVPEINIAVAHGQMEAEALDTIMNEFYDGKYDLLLSTSIIESGIDIPSANTIIIHRADRFGLAQLYQLRGRVGRSKVRAYAYLTLPTNRVATDNATKRLDVMRTLDTLGAGFTLASHDMDIRGFGNLLGEEQSGNIKEVGIELFQQMLEEAMAEIQAEERGSQAHEMPFSPQISMGASVMIPESYVADLSLRLGLYKRIANLKTEADIDAMAVELVDRFGSMPLELEHLLHTVRIKQICIRAGIEKLEVGPKGAMVTFYKNQFAKPELLLAHIHTKQTLFKLRPDNKVVIQNRSWETLAPRFKELQTLVGELASLAA